jgi:ankyrin
MNKLFSVTGVLTILVTTAIAVGCGQQRGTSSATTPELSRSDGAGLGARDARELSYAEQYIESARGVDIYKKAVIAAIHHFADYGQVDDLVGLLERHTDLVDARLIRGIRPPDTGDGYTPLHRAAGYGAPGPVEYLLERKANINADGGDGWTPLHLAARFGHLEVCRLLLERGANTNATTVPLPKRRMDNSNPASRAKPPWLPAEPARTPLDVAHLEKHQDIVDLFLAHAKTKRQDRASASNWSVFAEQSAARSGGVDPYKKALIVAIHYFIDSGGIEEVIGIIETYPDLVDARLVVAGREPKPDDGYAPIHRAAREGHSLSMKNLVEYLLDRKADINGDGGNGWTPLRIAEHYKGVEMARLLREKGAKEIEPKGPLPEPEST